MNKKGPFGLYMGMPLSEIGSNVEQVALGKYKVFNVPKPHSAFEYYAVRATPTYGLSWIKAIGTNIQTNVYGQQIQAAFKEMENKLSTIYGTHETIDLLLPGSIWNEPKDWMSAFIRKERFLIAIWSNDKGSRMSDDLNLICLGVEVIDSNTGYISVEYYFSNDEANESVIKAQEDDAL